MAKKDTTKKVSPKKDEDLTKKIEDLEGRIQELEQAVLYAKAESENIDRKSTRLNSSHSQQSRMPSSA